MSCYLKDFISELFQATEQLAFAVESVEDGASKSTKVKIATVHSTLPH